MFEYFGATPIVVVPDQLRSAVNGPDRYDPEINPTYADVARNYEVAIVPARTGDPRDKAKVENGVRITQRWIMACLRNRVFFGLEELNAAIGELLVKLNDRHQLGTSFYAASMPIPLVIWETGGHARVVPDVVRHGTEYQVVGFLDDLQPNKHGHRFCEAPVLGGREQLDQLRTDGIRHLVLAFGSNPAHKRIGAELVEWGFYLAVAFHPLATVAPDDWMGPGTVIMAGAVVNPNVSLGSNVIVNTCASIDHDSVLGDAVHVSPGAHMAGGVHVGDEAWIGLGSLVLEGRTVGPRTIVGAGAMVTRDLLADSVAYGVPARVVRPRGEADTGSFAVGPKVGEEQI